VTLEQISPDGFDSEPIGDTFPWIGAILTGSGTFLAGYLLLGLLIVVGPASFASDTALGEHVVWLAFVFYNAHNIGLVTDAQSVALSGSSGSINLIAQATNPDVPALVYYLLPVLVLFAAGVLFARRFTTEESLLDGMVKTGTMVGVGYLLTALLGTLVFTTTVEGAQLSIQQIRTALFGFAYPAVFCTLGAVCGTWLSTRFETGSTGEVATDPEQAER
jgi:hypothetical protein